MPARSNKPNQQQLTDAAEGLLLVLLDHFSVADAIFTESDAFDNKNASLGRLYRSWKAARKIMDPEFDSKRYKRKRYNDRSNRDE